ncbi:DUF1793-domain-containing protein [Purpureocillium lavendulum]|uniref:DUF1793-domain-containing protein n=1 Tax=Purpureocillium lavendulum TaxID=1247861 RepID=A0AB34FZI7_9HYPO|nr:DUF1793-domain-containing protein [Purpureocillium lavendulum]
MASFRRFRPDDVNKFSKCNLDPLTETYELGFYLQYYAKWPSLFQVCEDVDGNIVGYIMGKVESSPDAYKYSEHYLPWHAHITALTVAPEARRLGVGRILTEQLEAAADANDAWFVDLFVRKSNHRAIAFYESLGYSVYRVVKDYYGDHATDPDKDSEDAFDMRKSMRRDQHRRHIRDDGKNHVVDPEDVCYTVSLPTYRGPSYDASVTNLTYTLGAADSSYGVVDLVLSFVSPLTPTSTLRQSIPAAYLAVHVRGSIDISVYAEANGQWVSGTEDAVIQWEIHELSTATNTSGTPEIKSWGVARDTQLIFSESSDRAEWGEFRFSAASDAQHQAGPASTVRHQFAQNGYLSGFVDSHFRPLNESEPTFAFSKTFPLSSQSARVGKPPFGTMSTLFTFAFVQDPIVQFAAARGLTFMRPLWASYFATSDNLVGYHYKDFDIASRFSNDYTRRLEKDAEASGPDEYRDIVLLSARQVLGALQFSGTPENPMLFLKEISSSGNFQTVDVIFPTFPFFLYTNPRWLGYLLEPLLEHQLSGQYPNNYSMHDLGTHFPNATGHAHGDDEYMPVEECGNMLIMGLAFVNSMRQGSHQAWATPAPGRASPPRYRQLGLNHLEADGVGVDMPRPLVKGHESQDPSSAWSWVQKFYPLWRRWVGYLVRESLIPSNQLSTDDFAGWLANQTNLALKGIIGIRAMAGLSLVVGEKEDAQQYKSISSNYIHQWLEYGISRDETHAKLAYTWYGSWTTLYNLFADSLLCFHVSNSAISVTPGRQKPLNRQASAALIPDEVYSMQSKWYDAVLQRYGLPLDSRHLYAKSDWQLFAAAVASSGTRSAIVRRMALWVNETVTDEPPRYERDNRSASPRPIRDDNDGGRRRSASPNGNADAGPKISSGPRDDDDDGAINPGSNLFVTGIHPRLTEAEVSKMFEKYGDVEKCQIMRDPHTKESRGFGFVKMVTSDQAEAAKEGLQGEQIEGRTLSIEKARRARPRTPTPGKYFGPPKRDPRPRFDDRRRGGYGGGAGGSGRDDYRYRGYERGNERRYDDRRYDDSRSGYDRGYREERRYDDRSYGRDQERGYERRDRDDYYGRERYAGRDDRDRYAQRGGPGGYDRERYDRQSERDPARSREPAGGGSGYGESAARSDAREAYTGSEY